VMGNQKTRYAVALTVAGSDSGGGAGIQADLKTFGALGCYGMSVITALTAQNTVAVKAIHSVPSDFVALQLAAVLEDIGADAVKIGMLHSPEIVATVAECLRVHEARNVVLDPVMVAKSGDKLLLDDAVDALRAELLPLATVVTPNVPEAEILVGMGITDRAAMEEAGRRLLAMGPTAALVKGGHSGEVRSADCLVRADSPAGEIGASSLVCLWLEARRVETPNTHGTGCTLSSAITAYLALGLSVDDAVRAAKDYTTAAIAAGAEKSLGHGHGPVHHFHRWFDGE